MKTIELSDVMNFSGTPSELVQHLDKLANSSVFVKAGDKVYEDKPQNMSFRTTQKERETFDSYMYELSMIPKLSYDELNAAFSTASDEMRNGIAEHALHLVPDIAKIYTEPLSIDVLQAGNIGLLEAIAEYDSAMHDFDFVPYAVFRIRHAILEFVEEMKLIHQSDKTLQERSDEAARTFYRLKNSLGRVPTHKELCAECDIDEGLAHSVIEQLRGIPAHDSGNRQQSRQDESSRGKTNELLSQLSEQDAKVLRLLYGIDGSELTPAQIAEEMGISEDEVNKIAASALDYLRKNN